MKLSVVSIAAGILPALLLLAGCGSVANGEDPGVPLAVLNGTVSGSISSPPKTPYVAFLWATATPVTTGRVVAQIQSTFPSGYKLNLYQPPAEALFAMGLDAQGDFASGSAVTKPLLHVSVATVVVFDDANGNGDFDVLDAQGRPTSTWFEGDTFAPDRVTGWLKDAMEIYVADVTDPHDPSLGHYFANPDALTPGYHQVKLCYAPDASAPDQDNVLLKIQPDSTSLDLTLSEPTGTFPQESEPFMDVVPSSLPPCAP